PPPRSITRPRSRRRSTSSPCISSSTSTATACWRWLEEAERRQYRHDGELRTAGGAIEREGDADVIGLGLGPPAAHPGLVDDLAVVTARTHQPPAERAGHRRLGPAGVGRGVLARVAPRRHQRADS